MLSADLLRHALRHYLRPPLTLATVLGLLQY